MRGGRFSDAKKLRVREIKGWAVSNPNCNTGVAVSEVVRKEILAVLA